MYNKLKSDVFLREADVYYVGYGVSWRSMDSEIDVSIGHIGTLDGCISFSPKSPISRTETIDRITYTIKPDADSEIVVEIYKEDYDGND